jgi:hypothetical protein
MCVPHADRDKLEWDIAGRRGSITKSVEPETEIMYSHDLVGLARVLDRLTVGLYRARFYDLDDAPIYHVVGAD